MLAWLLALVLDLAAATPGGPLEIVPGVGMGPIRLGMREGDRPLDSPLTVKLDRRGRVRQVAAQLFYARRPRLLVRGRLFELSDEHGRTGRELARLVGRCRGPRTRGSEGLWEVWRCPGVTIADRLGDGDPEIIVTVHR